jgi:ADP-ribose diphosphatase
MKSRTDGGKVRPWRVQQSDLVFDNRWARVRRDRCELPDGKIVPDYYYWDGFDFAQTFAVTKNHEILLARQYKHGVKEIVTELPAGLVDPTDLSPVATAQRELQEETGYVGRDWLALGELHVSSAKATTRAFAFLARNVTKACEQSPDSNETIEVLTVGTDDVIDLISRGIIRDTSSIAITFLALQALGRGELRPPFPWR